MFIGVNMLYKCFFWLRNVFFFLIFKKDYTIKVQKSRYKSKPNLNFKLKFGEYGILFKDEGRLEFVQFNFIKKAIKPILKESKHAREFWKKVWYNITSNHVIQCKSKNSRMGKGKGLFERKIIRISKNTILFEFVGVSFFKLNFVSKKINKKLKIDTFVYSENKNIFKLPTKKSFLSVYFNNLLKSN